MNARLLLVVLLAGAACGGGCGDGAGGADATLRDDVPELQVRGGAERAADEALRRAERLFEADAPRDAEPFLRRALELDPRHREARRLLARALVEQRRHADATPLLRELVAETPDDAELLAQLTACLHAIGELDEAEKAYNAWLEVDAANDDAHFGLGQVLYDLGRYDEAVQSFRRAEKRRAGRADVRSELGLALHALGRLDEAEEKQRDALERDPRSAEAWFRLGDVVSRSDPPRAAEAIDAMRQAVQLDPRHVHAQLFLYRLLRQEIIAGASDLEPEATRRWRSVLRQAGVQQVGRRAGAPRVEDASSRRERRLREQLEAAPDDAAVRRELAQLLHADGALDAARVQYEALLAAGAEDALLLTAAGVVALATGDAARAVLLLERSAALPDTPPATQRYLAWALLLSDDAAAALARYDTIVAANEGDMLARRGRGLALMRLDRLDEGLQEIAAAGWLR